MRLGECGKCDECVVSGFYFCERSHAHPIFSSPPSLFLSPPTSPSSHSHLSHIIPHPSTLHAHYMHTPRTLHAHYTHTTRTLHAHSTHLRTHSKPHTPHLSPPSPLSHSCLPLTPLNFFYGITHSTHHTPSVKAGSVTYGTFSSGCNFPSRVRNSQSLPPEFFRYQEKNFTHVYFLLGGNKILTFLPGSNSITFSQKQNF